ncbi:TolB family protein, partial [candidate division KSB1 bacterium]
MKNVRLFKSSLLFAVLLALITVSTFHAAFAQEALLSLNDVMRNNPPLEGSRPGRGSISPDNQWMVFTWRNPDINKTRDGLYKVRIPGGTPEEIMTPSRGMVRWMDGLDHSLMITERNKVMLMDVGTGEKTEFLEGSGITMNHVYSPDRSKIAFSDNDGLWLMNSDGTDKKLLKVPGANNFRWTADGSRIFYFADSNIWYVDVKSRKVTKVTN